MPELNQVTVTANLVRDPEVRTTATGIKVANLRLAIHHTYYDQKDAKQQETCWIDASLWGRQAEAAEKHLKKGAPVLITGRLFTDAWEKDGQKFSKTIIRADRFQFLDKPPATGQDPKPADHNVPF
jgi:single-strand DNA-binding protein